MRRLVHRLTGLHEPLERHPLGGYRCLGCHAPIADLAEAGLLDSAFVSPTRPRYERLHGSITRTSADEKSRHGGTW